MNGPKHHAQQKTPKLRAAATETTSAPVHAKTFGGDCAILSTGFPL
jgi:hypothetical protein